MSDTLYHTSGHRAPVWRRVRSESMGPIRHVDLSDDRASRRSPWVITGRTTTQPLRLKKSSWKMHQEHAADSDMVEAN